MIRLANKGYVNLYNHETSMSWLFVSVAAAEGEGR